MYIWYHGRNNLLARNKLRKIHFFTHYLSDIIAINFWWEIDTFFFPFDTEKSNYFGILALIIILFNTVTYACV